MTDQHLPFWRAAGLRTAARMVSIMVPIRCLAGAIAAALMWSSAAPAAIPLDRLEISLWPDYDRAAVLVIMRGQLSPTIPLPTTVSLPMPARAGSPHAVAKRTAEGNLLTAEYAVVGDADWASIEITSDLPEIRLEYYIDFDSSAPERRYVFSWPGGLGLDQVGVRSHATAKRNGFLHLP